MGRVRMYSLVLAMGFVLCSFGIAFGEGGGFEHPPGAPTYCFTDPFPPVRAKSGPFIIGEFTVALDRFTDSLNYPEAAHYNFQVTLMHGREVHLFSYWIPVGGRNICEYTDQELKTLYARVPCALNVGQTFGFGGLPLVTELVVYKRDFCSSPNIPPAYAARGWNVPEEAMIAGVITIRVVPYNP